MKACTWSMARLALAMLSLWAGTAHSLIILDSRTSSYGLTGLGGDFSGAVAGYGIVASGSADVPGVVPLQLQTKSDAVGVAVSGGGAFSANVTNQTNTVTDFSLSAAPGTGQVNVGYSTAASDSFARSWIVRGAEPGFSTLHFTGGGFGFVPLPLDPNDGIDRTAFFDVFITLEGDWSAIGSGAGQLQFLGFDSAWAIDQFFEYDAVDNVTRFHAANAAYSELDYAAFRTPNIDFILRLAAVPAPGTLPILLLGLAVLACARRHS